MNNSIGLYVHIPFCKSKCPYCDFYSINANAQEYDFYVKELSDKIKYLSKQTDKAVATIYFGGGTPSVLGAERLCFLLNCVKENFNVLQNNEVTCEINPDTGKNIDFEAMLKSGFNRISVGLQTAVPEELKLLGRIHTAEEAKQTVVRAKKSGINNISLDLMMGIPNQTTDSLRRSIDFCSECEATHISSYILKLEENTPLYKMQNSFKLADDDMQAQMYLEAVNQIESYGYKQYEISNFAFSGFESRHNINYWKCGEYLGIGPSAHSFLNGKRFYYGRSIKDFCDNKIIFDSDGGSEEEFIMLSLRLKSGLDFSEYKRRYKKEIPEKLKFKARQLEKAGYLHFDKNHISLTPAGFLVSNSIIAELI